MRILHALPLLIAIAPAFGQYAAPQPVFSKTFGGSSGSDAATRLAVDPQGNVAVLGGTSSPDFPVTANAYQSQPSQPPLFSIGSNGVSYPAISAPGVTALGASSDGAVIYAGASTGVYRSSTGGSSWTRQTNSFIDASSMVVDAGSSNTLYAAIPNFIGPYIIGGVYKSTDGGANWSFLNSLRGGALLASAKTPGLVYNTVPAIYRSADGGSTWSANLSPHTQTVYAAALAASDPTLIYAVGADGLLYKSTDTGNTWTAPGGSFPTYPNVPAQQDIVALAVDPLNKNELWALSGIGTLSKSTDGGTSFTTVIQTGGSARSLSVDPSGQIIVAGGSVSFDSGASWQSLPSASANVVLATSKAALVGSSSAGPAFLTKWNADGSMIFSTFLSISGGMQYSFAASDAAGDTWVVADSLLKFDPAGKLLLSQSLGMFTASAVTVDTAGNLYLAGGPPACPAQIMEFNPQGTLLFSQSVQQLCQASLNGIAVDPAGAVYLVGSTSTSLSTTSSAIQPVAPPPPSNPNFGPSYGFLAALSPQARQLTYLSYVGSGLSMVNGVAVDSAGSVYVTGSSADISSPLTAGATASFRAGSCAFDGLETTLAFTAKLNLFSRVPLWVAEIGGCKTQTRGSQIALDAQGNVWLGGYTNSGAFPTVAPLELTGYHLSFVSELSADGKQLLFSSFAPGPFALGPDQSLYLTGAVLPNPPKIGIQVFGSSGTTSAFVERLNLSGSQAAVIASVTSAVPIAGDTYTQYLTIAPGELVRITGQGLGPSTAAGAQFDANGRVATLLAGTRVLFNGVAAPLISVQDSTVECVAPFEIGDLSNVGIQIERNGSAMPGVLIGVTPVAFVASVLAVVNADGTLNSQSNPAHAGKPVTLYVSGFGDTNPAVPDGAVYAAPLPAPLYPLSSGLLYAGPAPGMVAGVWQVNLIPQVQPGNTGNPVQLGINSSLSIDSDYPVASASVWLAP